MALLRITNILRAKDMKNTEISRYLYTGTGETHTDRPRYFWGIGSNCRLGHPSKCQNSPRARRNHITASQAIFHTPMYSMFTWAKFRLPSTESLKNKTRVVVVGGGGGFWHGEGWLLCFFCPRETRTLGIYGKAQATCPTACLY
jgi:hypothetical protein